MYLSSLVIPLPLSTWLNFQSHWSLVIGKFSPITHYPLPVTHKPLANYALTIFYSFDMIIGLLFVFSL
ncbi:MAG: hypothetical protein ACK4V0_11425 [Aphanizomenon sp.]